MKQNKFSVRLLKHAEDDLADIVTYIGEDSISAADKIASHIEKNLIISANIPT